MKKRATDLFPRGDAWISSDGVYRHRLTREFGSPKRAYDPVGDTYYDESPWRVLIWIMLNPSIADAQHDDPTIRRCMDFTVRWGFHRMVVANLYSFRATSPNAMWSARLSGTDIVGEDNNSAITRAIMESSGTLDRERCTRCATDDRYGSWQSQGGTRPTLPDFVCDRCLAPGGMAICAWGAANSLPKALRDAHRQRVEFVRRLIGNRAYALGLNEDGSPVHPLYQPATLTPKPWALAA